MSFDWRDYLRLAENLEQQAPDSSYEEAKLRSAASRAYYAAFRFARNCLRDHTNYTPSTNRNTHYEVQEQLQDLSSRELIKASKNLRRLHGLRKKADYEDIISNPKKACSQSVKYAGNIVITLRNHFSI